MVYGVVPGVESGRGGNKIRSMRVAMYNVRESCNRLSKRHCDLPAHIYITGHYEKKGNGVSQVRRPILQAWFVFNWHGQRSDAQSQSACISTHSINKLLALTRLGFISLPHAQLHNVGRHELTTLPIIIPPTHVCLCLFYPSDPRKQKMGQGGWQIVVLTSVSPPQRPMQGNH